MTPEEQAEFDAMKSDLATAQTQLADSETARANLASAVGTHESRHAALAREHRVWAMAWSDVAPYSVPTGMPSENDTPGQVVEKVARAALTDTIGLVCDGRLLGLEAVVTRQYRAVMGDPEIATALGRLAQLRASDDDTAAPTGVVARTRGAVKSLQELSQNLPDGDARQLIARVLRSQVAPEKALADELFRTLIEGKVPAELASQAHGAVSEIRAAFLAQAPSP